MFDISKETSKFQTLFPREVPHNRSVYDYDCEERREIIDDSYRTINISTIMDATKDCEKPSSEDDQVSIDKCNNM
jgi:hypothetical protein